MSTETSLAVSDRPTRADRDARGYFAKGNTMGAAGRPKGSENRTQLDLREIKAAVVASWKTCDGPRLLRQLARRNPEAYIRLVIGLLPRDLEAALQPIAIIVRDEKQLAFAEAYKRGVEEDGLPGNEAVIEALAAVRGDPDFDYLDGPTTPCQLPGPGELQNSVKCNEDS